MSTSVKFMLSDGTVVAEPFHPLPCESLSRDDVRVIHNDGAKRNCIQLPVDPQSNRMDARKCAK